MTKLLACFLAIFLLSFSLVSSDLKGQFEKVMQKDIKGDAGQILLEIGQEFKGIPYVAHTLESEAGESLVCRFDAFDCTTLVENLVALTRAKMLNYDFDQFKAELTRVRYKNGEITDYASRLHYFTDWAYENEKRGAVEDITREIGGVINMKKIHFMTTKKDLYKGITSNEILNQIGEAENQINARKRYFIPVNKIASIEHQLKDGDIIGITSTIEGLDCNHQGVVKQIGNRAYLFHASSKEMKVVLSEQTLEAYVGSSKRNSGIIVVRLKEPNY